MKKIDAINFVLDQVKTNDQVLVEAVQGLYARQTEDEQVEKTVKDRNSRGFYPRDCSLLTSAAVEVSLHGTFQSEELKNQARARIVRYRRQLLEIFGDKYGIKIVRGRPGRDAQQAPEVPQPIVEFGPELEVLSVAVGEAPKAVRLTKSGVPDKRFKH